MYKRKSKIVRQYIQVIYGENQLCNVYKKGEIPIKESVIINKSIQFFNDPEPCYIHRGAVSMRINEELMEELEKYEEREKIKLNKEGNMFQEVIDLHLIQYIAWFKE